MVAVSGRTLVLAVAVSGRTLVLATAMVGGTLAMTTAVGSRTLVLAVEGRTMSTRRRCLLPEPACLLALGLALSAYGLVRATRKRKNSA
jgi:hypothetical protein